jgi:quercetin dioxygenase-like cupin family protein
LIATEGIGFIKIVKRIEEMSDGKYSFVIEDSTEFRDGESVIIPAGKIHWHGAKRGSKDKFSHIAILRNMPTIWL